MTLRRAQGHPEPRRGGIDLHLHTTASDGWCSPEQLVQQAAAVGLTTMAVTDHDTTAAVGSTADHCARHGISLVPGIEITAVEDGRDVHVLGYFFDVDSEALSEFLVRQRADRIARVEAIASRLASLGLPVDMSRLVADVQRHDGRSIGRPQVARALVAAGHVVDVREAFDRWLGADRPAFVPRSGASPEKVIETIHLAGGLASLAHPGRTKIDGRIPALREAGLDALEAYHSDHDPPTRDRYRQMARALGLLVTGGSDYHADPEHGLVPGFITLPAQEWEQLSQWPRRS